MCIYIYTGKTHLNHHISPTFRDDSPKYQVNVLLHAAGMSAGGPGGLPAREPNFARSDCCENRWSFPEIFKKNLFIIINHSILVGFVPNK